MNILAILASDIHLSHQPPTARSAENDWYAAMGRQLRQLRDLALKHKVPVIIAGDVFDRWNSPPELINFAIKQFGDMMSIFAIPGQHDLPNHSYDDIKRSAYWTLVESGVMETLDPRVPTVVSRNLVAWGFPWGFPLGVEVVREHQTEAPMVHLAVVHAYCWAGKNKYPDAPTDQNVLNYKLDGFDAAVFGDNHKGFLAKNCVNANYSVLNAGTFFRRRHDEHDYKPTVGLLSDDGSIKLHRLDVGEDKWIKQPSLEKEEQVDLRFLADLKALDADSFDFESAVRTYMKSAEVTESTLDAMRGILDEAIKARTT